MQDDPSFEIHTLYLVFAFVGVFVRVVDKVDKGYVGLREWKILWMQKSFL